jgi:CubicO group peptidase (beta-lactamase class C family)
MVGLTRRSALGSLLPVVAASGCATPSSPPGDSVSLIPNCARETIDRLFAMPEGQITPGYALGIIKEGDLVFAKGYGFANLEDAAPIATGTAFHIASLSKQFTGAAVALSILDGRVTLEDSIARHLPEFASFAADVRIKHLIYMTSGLPEYSSVPRASGLPWFSPFRFTTAEAIATVAAARRTEFAPGTRWAYSNTNYMLLTEIVSRVHGVSFGHFLKERVFAPLGMTASLIDDDGLSLIPQRAIGYAPKTPHIVRDLDSVGISVSEGSSNWLRMNRVSPHYGGSGVFTTIEDWLMWDRNWTSHQLAGPRFTELMHSRMRFDHPKDNDAFGLVFGDYAGRTRIWYSGGDLDASSYVARFPDQRLTVCCLSNNPAGQAEQRVTSILNTLVSASLL